MESFSKFKDWLLGGLLVFTASVAWQTHKTVNELKEGRIQEVYERKIMQMDIDNGKQKDNEQDKRITQIEAILNKDEKKNNGNIAERQTE